MIDTDNPLTRDGPWKCFHCWEIFTDVTKAAKHFGPWPENHNFPLCAPKRYREQVAAKDEEIKRMRKLLGRFAMYALQHQQTELRELAQTLHITFPDGAPYVSLASPTGTILVEQAEPSQAVDNVSPNKSKTPAENLDQESGATET